jgi:hypothetical protein
MGRNYCDYRDLAVGQLRKRSKKYYLAIVETRNETRAQNTCVNMAFPYFLIGIAAVFCRYYTSHLLLVEGGSHQAFAYFVNGGSSCRQQSTTSASSADSAT